jgi:predicted nucleic acid-binding protein
MMVMDAMKRIWRGLQKRIARAIIQYALDQLVISPELLQEIQRRTKLSAGVARIITEVVFDSIVRALNEALEGYDAKE